MARVVPVAGSIDILVYGVNSDRSTRRCPHMSSSDVVQRFLVMEPQGSHDVNLSLCGVESAWKRARSTYLVSKVQNKILIRSNYKCRRSHSVSRSGSHIPIPSSHSTPPGVSYCTCTRSTWALSSSCGTKGRCRCRRRVCGWAQCSTEEGFQGS